MDFKDNKGRFIKGFTHKKFYAKTPESWINWYIGESENRTIQRVIRSNKSINNNRLKQVNYNGKISYRKIKPSTCLCHNTNLHNTKSRTIYKNVSKHVKSKWSGIINQLDLIQSTKRRIKNRVYHLNNIENEAIYHKKRNIEIRQIVLMAYTKSNTPNCICCNACHIDMLALDHVDGGGNKHRKSLNTSLYSYLYNNYKKTGKWIPGYQVMCTSCNWIKYIRGSCGQEYHKKLSVEIQIGGDAGWR